MVEAAFVFGLAVGLAVSMFGMRGVWDRGYALGVKHGRELEVTEQWGADVREALTAATPKGGANADS